MRKRYKNEIKDLKILIGQEIELGTKKQKKEDKVKKHRIRIDIIISEAEDLNIRLINKLNEMKKIRTEINELEKEKDLDCINMMEILKGYEKLAQIIYLILIKSLIVYVDHSLLSFDLCQSSMNSTNLIV